MRLAWANLFVQRTRDSRCSLQFGRQWSRAADIIVRHRHWCGLSLNYEQGYRTY